MFKIGGYEDMKIKLFNSVFVYLILLLFFSISLVTIRTFQLILFTDFETGFYCGPEYLNYLFLGIILLFAIIILLLICKDSTKYQLKLFLSKCYILKIFSIITAFFLVIYLFTYIFSIFKYNQTNKIMACFVFVFGILATICYIYLPIRIKKDKGGFTDITFLFPCLFASVQLINMFLEYMVMFSIMENMINILRITSLSIFLLCLGKLIARVEGKLTQKIMVFTGFISILLSLCNIIPDLIIYIISFINKTSYIKQYENNNIADSAPFDFIVSIFALIFLIQYFMSRKKEKEKEIES